ncbi:hypothetical protein RI845_02760 [Thalassotalea nanhaiensis]|uniref:Uncharacterized protein n=1 Tax=Thalassotalea nanhaiensis TaxID=3065648 RepID=A0ABY9TKF5_9GAMM|nr:hypothetical protein RI845_02760 [Colwelliaceae bacterium SQ345]
MSKLFKLKEWLTLKEAANHISTVLGESVTLADIYRLALDKHITLSADFVNGAQARTGKFVKTDDIEFRKVENHLFTGEKLEDPYLSPLNNETYVFEDDWVSLDSKTVSIKGLWDLTMIGSEALDIEHYYQQETSGLKVTLTCLEGTLLRQGDVICQLQSDFDDNEYQQGSKAAKQKLEQFITSNKLTDDEIKKLRDEYQTERKAYLGGKREFERVPSYYPSGGLDEHDYVLVVKTNEVTRFIQSLEGTPPEAKPLTSKERNSLLVLLGAVCKNADIDPSQRGIATSLVALTELIGAPLTDDTIRKILNQIEPAIESRSK